MNETQDYRPPADHDRRLRARTELEDAVCQCLEAGMPAFQIRDMVDDAIGEHEIRVGQVWQDTYLERFHTRWTVRVVKLNTKSVRVQPRDRYKGWQPMEGPCYRMERKYFANGRMRLVGGDA
jgi:hypothetical protein